MAKNEYDDFYDAPAADNPDLQPASEYVDLGPSKEQLEATTDEAPHIPEDLARAMSGEQVEFRSDTTYEFTGGTPEQPSCFDDVNEQILQDQYDAANQE